MKRIVMIGATGAVGGHCARALAGQAALVALGRRADPALEAEQHVVDLSDPATFAAHLAGADAAICCLGVGEPSKVSREEFRRIDHDLPLTFARACREAGVAGFSLLSSVGASSGSRSFFLRSKGELENALRALPFKRLTLVHPSMILTPENRYGLSQALTLAIWPRLDAVLRGPLKKLRGVPVEVLGRAIAIDALSDVPGARVLEWPEITSLGAE